MAYRTRWTRLFSGVALAVTAALAAAGCTSGPASTATAGTAAASVPAVTLAQATQAFTSYVATSNKAALTGDQALALSDVTGVQWSQVSYDFKAYRLFRTPLPYPRFSYPAPALYVPAPAGYPRWFAASVTRTQRPPLPATVQTGPQPMMLVFTQASATAPWLLASSSLVASSVPALALNKDGQARLLTMSQTAGLLVRPDVVGPLVAAFVDDGPSSPAARAVAANPLLDGEYLAARDGMGLTTPRGDVHQWELVGSNSTPFAVRTKDGGALVFFTMYLNNTVEVPAELNQSDTVNPGPVIKVPADLRVLLPSGTTAPRKQLARQDLVSFVAVDPPAGDAKVQVIALGEAENYASAS